MLETGEITLTEAALQLGISWHRAWRLMLVGDLDGRKGDNGRYTVTQASVERVKVARSGAEGGRVAATA